MKTSLLTTLFAMTIYSASIINGSYEKREQLITAFDTALAALREAALKRKAEFGLNIGAETPHNIVYHIHKGEDSQGRFDLNSCGEVITFNGKTIEADGLERFPALQELIIAFKEYENTTPDKVLIPYFSDRGEHRYHFRDFEGMTRLDRTTDYSGLAYKVD